VDTGHLVYVQSDGTLLAVPFDLDELEVVGAPVPLVEGIVMQGGGAARFAASRNGTLVYASGSGNGQLMLVDRRGVAEPLTTQPGEFETPRFSPEGDQIAVTREGATRDVWIYQIEQGNLRRLTFQGDNRYPIWRQDGERVAFTSTRDSSISDLFWVPADGTGEPELLFGRELDLRAGSWSADGRTLVVRQQERRGALSDLSMLQVNGQRSLTRLTVTPYDEASPQLSPDGRWLAYVSDETGQDEVYVRAFPDLGPKILISNDGGTEPVWGPEGHELFYRAADRFFAVAIEPEPEFQVGPPTLLFEGAFTHWRWHANYDVHPDGDHFVMVRRPEGTSDALTVVLNWSEELRRGVQPQ
jgi:dipeptidyl aminopeptidase/acylaminoacyl peptidase